MLDDFLAQLDSGLRYRFSELQPPPQRLYASSVVVEFEKKVSAGVGTINTIVGILNEVIQPQDCKYGLRRLSFSCEDPPTPAPVTILPLMSMVLPSVRQIVPAEFVIEPRAGEPRERGRFFCSAPLRTSDHLRMLEKIERAVVAGT